MSTGLFTRILESHEGLYLTDSDRGGEIGGGLNHPDRKLTIVATSSGDDQVEVTLDQAEAHKLLLALFRYERKWKGERERRERRQARQNQ
jgi:hypothetical protein